MPDLDPSTPTDLSKGERTRAALVDAAYRLFIERGYHGTSMRQIADEVGLALGGAYNHFGSKEAIFEAVLTAYHPYHDVLPALENAQGATLEELVRDAATRAVEAFRMRHDTLQLLFVEIVEFDRIHVSKLFEQVFPRMMAFAQRLQEVHGPLRPLPLIDVLRTFIGMFFSYFLTEMLIGEQLPAKLRRNSFDHAVDIFLHGVLERDASEG
jgi:AcrR family transcriptional regulator